MSENIMAEFERVAQAAWNKSGGERGKYYSPEEVIAAAQRASETGDEAEYLPGDTMSISEVRGQAWTKGIHLTIRLIYANDQTFVIGPKGQEVFYVLKRGKREKDTMRIGLYEESKDTTVTVGRPTNLSLVGRYEPLVRDIAVSQILVSIL